MQKAIDIVKQAIDEDNKQNFAEAYRLYQNSLEHFFLAMKCNKKKTGGDVGRKQKLILPSLDEKNERAKEALKKKCTEYLDRAEKLKEFLKKSEKKKLVAEEPAGGKPRTRRENLGIGEKFSFKRDRRRDPETPKIKHLL